MQTLQQIIDHMLASSSEATAPDPVLSKLTTPEITQVPVVETIATIERQILSAVPLTEQQEKISLAKDTTVWVTVETPEFTQAICKSLKQQHLNPKIVSLDAVPDSTLAGLIILVPVKPDQTFMKESFKLVQRVSTSLRAAGQSNSAILVSVTQMGGRFGLDGVGETCPVSGGIAGLIKTADKEWPEVSCKAIDIENSGDVTKLADQIVSECWLKGSLEVGITMIKFFLILRDQFMQHFLYFFPDPQGQGSFRPTELLIT